MNNYPDLPTLYDEKDWPIERPMSVKRATNGQPHVRVLGDIDWRDQTISHPRLTSAEYATFMAFRAANLGIEFAYARTRGGVVQNFVGVFNAKLTERYIRPGNWTITVGVIMRAA